MPPPNEGQAPKAPAAREWMAELAFQQGIEHRPPPATSTQAMASEGPMLGFALLPPEVLAALHEEGTRSLASQSKTKAPPPLKAPKSKALTPSQSLPSLSQAQSPPSSKPSGLLKSVDGWKTHLAGLMQASSPPQAGQASSPGAAQAAQASNPGAPKDKAAAPMAFWQGQSSHTPDHGSFGPLHGPSLGTAGGTAFTWTFDPIFGWRFRPQARSKPLLRVAEAELGPQMPILDPLSGASFDGGLPAGEVEATRSEVGPVHELEWAKELLNIMTGINLGEFGAIAPEQLAGPKLDELRALLQKLPAAPPGFSLDMVPRSFNAFDAAMRQGLEVPTRRLAAEVAALPVVEAAFAVWDVKKPEQNQRVLNEVYARVVGLMGGLLRFEPAPLAWPLEMKRACYGYYSFAEHAVMLSESLFRLPLQEALATVLHEQAHALQGEWIARLGLPNRPTRLRSIRPLSHQERALALCWLWEFPRLNAYHSGQSKALDPQAAERMYRRFALEHHAFFTEKLVVEACNQAHRGGQEWAGRLHHQAVAFAQDLLKAQKEGPQS